MTSETEGLADPGPRQPEPELTMDYCSSAGEAARPSGEARSALTDSYCFVKLFYGARSVVACVRFQRRPGEFPLNAVVVRRRAAAVPEAEMGGGSASRPRHAGPSSKPERARLFPIRGLSLSSRH